MVIYLLRGDDLLQVPLPGAPRNGLGHVSAQDLNEIRQNAFGESWDGDIPCGGSINQCIYIYMFFIVINLLVLLYIATIIAIIIITTITYWC